jgi:outer membrane protein assembly factor BamB
MEEKIARALGSVATSPELLAGLESKSGFIIESAKTPDGWPDWRGPGRKGFAPKLPAKLPVQLPRIWSAPLTGPPMAGAAVSGEYVVVPDKSSDGKQDIFHCLDTADGRELWRLAYEAPDDLEYTNAPRATPVIRDGLVYLQGALGHLHCVRLATGDIVWKRHLFDDFGAKRLTWGASVSPLLDGERLIVAPGAKDASVVALDRRTGAVLWKTSGHAAAYSAFVRGTFDGVEEIVGYDSAGIGGWDPATGRRLWEVIPPDGSDFNVTTPVIIGQQILLAGENNATRLHRFDGGGKLVAEPGVKNGDLAPDTCTPAVARGRIFSTAYGELFCLDLANGLKTVWRQPGEMFHDHSNIVASEDRILIWTASGDLLLLDAAADEYRPVSHIRPFDEAHPDSLAHPAFAGDRIYLRSSKELVCFKLTGE